MTNGEAADAGHCAFKYQSDWAPATFRWFGDEAVGRPDSRVTR